MFVFSEDEAPIELIVGIIVALTVILVLVIVIVVLLRRRYPKKGFELYFLLLIHSL